jgi:hypothetical protein
MAVAWSWSSREGVAQFQWRDDDDGDTIATTRTMTHGGRVGHDELVALCDRGDARRDVDVVPT